MTKENEDLRNADRVVEALEALVDTEEGRSSQMLPRRLSELKRSRAASEQLLSEMVIVDPEKAAQRLLEVLKYEGTHAFVKVRQQYLTFLTKMPLHL